MWRKKRTKNEDEREAKTKQKSKQHLPPQHRRERMYERNERRKDSLSVCVSVWRYSFSFS